MDVLSERWENQQRDGELRCRYVAREFRSLDPTREGLFTPSSELTTGRLIDLRAVKFGFLTVLLDAIKPPEEPCSSFPAPSGSPHLARLEGHNSALVC